MNVSAWRKSSRSGSGSGQNCVEVGAWRKSSRSGSSGSGASCVEVGASTAAIAVRDTKHVTGPVLTAARGEWTSFLASVKSGEFDL